MKYKLDENLGPNVLQVFLHRGLDCHTVDSENLRGADDATILAAAVKEGRILVTMDHDFGNVLAFPPETTCGVAILNPPGTVSRPLLAKLVESFLNARERGELQGNLWIVEPGRIREHLTSAEGESE